MTSSPCDLCCCRCCNVALNFEFWPPNRQWQYFLETGDKAARIVPGTSHGRNTDKNLAVKDEIQSYRENYATIKLFVVTDWTRPQVVYNEQDPVLAVVVWHCPHHPQQDSPTRTWLFAFLWYSRYFQRLGAECLDGITGEETRKTKQQHMWRSGRADLHAEETTTKTKTRPPVNVCYYIFSQLESKKIEE